MVDRCGSDSTSGNYFPHLSTVHTPNETVRVTAKSVEWRDSWGSKYTRVGTLSLISIDLRSSCSMIFKGPCDIMIILQGVEINQQSHTIFIQSIFHVSHPRPTLPFLYSQLSIITSSTFLPLHTIGLCYHMCHAHDKLYRKS